MKKIQKRKGTGLISDFGIDLYIRKKRMKQS
jgi:hypothetical protein